MKRLAGDFVTGAKADKLTFGLLRAADFKPVRYFPLSPAAGDEYKK